VEPGLEVGVGGSILSTNNGNIGIGSTIPFSKLTLSGDLLISGVTTSSIFVGNLVGDVIAITGLIDNISGVAATYTSVYATDLISNTGEIDYLSGTNSNYSGISSAQNLVVQDQFNVYASTATFHNNVSINGNLSIGGTSFAVSASELQVADKNIILGFSTTTNASDDSSNHGGIAIASTEGTSLVDMRVVGINSFPPTYKQILWVKSNTMGAGTTDAFLFNYGVGIGSTLVPTGTILSVGSVQINSQGNIRATSSIVGSAVTINSTGINVTGIVTASSISDSDGDVRRIPQNSKVAPYILVIGDSGKHISITTGGVTVPSGVFSAGDAITIFNNSGSNQTITQGASTTLRFAGTSSTGNRTLSQYGLVSILCVASNTFVISGAGLT
jgi:hypothetical protein